MCNDIVVIQTIKGNETFDTVTNFSKMETVHQGKESKSFIDMYYADG